MTLIVQKYGGTSLSTSARIRDVASRIGLERRAGRDVVAVVSAMGDTTDHLLRLAAEIAPQPDPRELDMLLTTGERISMALLAMALNASGLRSISLTGSQSGIITDGAHTRARIVDVKGDRIQEALADGRIVIVAGFQGVSPAREITTLGRGGSDLTAVAIASRFAAARCEIYTDVDGVYTADPGRVPAARRIDFLDLDTMVAYSELGAGVLHPRAARWAAREKVHVVIRSSFIPGAGTTVSETRGAGQEPVEPAVAGIGTVSRSVVFEFPVAPGRVAEALSVAGETPLRLATASGKGTFAAVEENLAAEVGERMQAAGVTPVVRRSGDLISAIHRPGIDVAAAIEECLTPEWRVLPALLCGARSTSLLVDPRHADEVVLTLHRALIEAPLVPHPA